MSIIDFLIVLFRGKKQPENCEHCGEPFEEKDAILCDNGLWICSDCLDNWDSEE